MKKSVRNRRGKLGVNSCATQISRFSRWGTFILLHPHRTKSICLSFLASSGVRPYRPQTISATARRYRPQQKTISATRKSISATTISAKTISATKDIGHKIYAEFIWRHRDDTSRFRIVRMVNFNVKEAYMFPLVQRR